MEIIYRIQDSDGRGPFKPGFSHQWINFRKDHRNLRTWAEEFGFEFVRDQIIVGETFGCGCKNLDQLKRWFDKSEYEKLKKFGYKAVKMKIDRIIAESEIQCVFGRTYPLNMDVKTIQLY